MSSRDRARQHVTSFDAFEFPDTIEAEITHRLGPATARAVLPKLKRVAFAYRLLSKKDAVLAADRKRAEKTQRHRARMIARRARQLHDEFVPAIDRQKVGPGAADFFCELLAKHHVAWGKEPDHLRGIAAAADEFVFCHTRKPSRPTDINRRMLHIGVGIVLRDCGRVKITASPTGDFAQMLGMMYDALDLQPPSDFGKTLRTLQAILPGWSWEERRPAEGFPDGLRTGYTGWLRMAEDERDFAQKIRPRWYRDLE